MKDGVAATGIGKAATTMVQTPYPCRTPKRCAAMAGAVAVMVKAADSGPLRRLMNSPANRHHRPERPNPSPHRNSALHADHVTEASGKRATKAVFHTNPGPIKIA